MFDIEKELKTLGAKKHCPDETLRQRTVEYLSKASKKAMPQKTLTLRWVSASAALVVLAAVLLFTVLPGTQQTSYFTIDINPSIGFEVDQSGVILSVKAQNSDAESLLTGLDLDGMSFIDALRCVVQAAEQQGYLKDNGHVLVAHFGVSGKITETQVETAVLESTHKQVNVLLLQSDRNDYEDATQTHQSAGIVLLMKNAQKLGIEDADINDIIQTIKKNNNNHGNNSSHNENSASATAASDQSPEPTDDSQKTNNGSNGNHGNSGNNGPSNNGNDNSGNNSDNGNNSNSDNGNNGNNSNNGNNGQSDKDDK